MIKTLVIDNEKDSRDLLQWQLSRHCPSVKVLESVGSSTDALSRIEKLEPQLIFLDIQMPVLNGFELLEKLNPVDFEVIFTTAYDEFAVKAFRYNAMDYLLKPIDTHELKAAVTRVELKINTRRTKPGAQMKVRDKRMALSTPDSIIFVDPENIIYCESRNNDTYFHLNTGEGKILIARNISQVREMLIPYGFHRIHNSYLVNMKYAREYVRGPGGYIVMENGDHLTVARSRKDEFFESFLKF